MARNSSYFNVSHIKIVDDLGMSAIDRTEMLSLYKGRNIFEIDINSLAARVRNQHPIIKQAVVKRVLPNTLEIEIVPRVPVATIRSRELYAVDRTGMILPLNGKNSDLPVITGLSIWLNPRVGQRLESQRLESAFLLIDALREVSFRSDNEIVSIDASNYRNLSAYLRNGIEIKIGNEDFPGRLKNLKATLENPDLNKDNMRYIDLRFRDVVIGPK